MGRLFLQMLKNSELKEEKVGEFHEVNRQGHKESHLRTSKKNLIILY